MMKIRTDFVTNSSSSSFILGFKDEDSVEKELFDGFPKYAREKFEYVKNDVDGSERLSKEHVEKSIRDYFYDCILWDKIRKQHFKDYSDIEKFENDENVIKDVSEAAESKFKLYQDRVNNNSVFVEIEYDDHCNPDLEHEIMPSHKSTIIRFNHH